MHLRGTVRVLLVLLVLIPAVLGATTDHASAQSTSSPYQASLYAELFQGALDDIDRYWRAQFGASGLTYRTPVVRWLESVESDACGTFDPQVGPGAYCPLDETIVLSVPWYDQLMADGIDFAWVTVTAHEWGHHAQSLLGLRPGAGSSFELQADCLAGVYAQDAAASGLLEQGDITEAVAMSSSSGDPVWLPADHPGAHGSGDERLTSFMRGYINGVADCGTDLGVMSLERPPDTTAQSLTIESLLPDELALPQGQQVRIRSEGISTFNDMVAALPGEPDARERLTGWGWLENVYRTYVVDSPPVNGASSIAIGIHLFDSADGAAEALPHFADARRESTGYAPTDVGLFADQTEAMSGQSPIGVELIIYARRGNLLFRVTGVAPTGDPTADVFEALLVPLRLLVDEPRVVSRNLYEALPGQVNVPAGLRLSEEHARSAASVAATFTDPTEAERLFQEWGWRESAARVFTGDAPSGGNRLEVSVFRMADSQAAEEALPYFLEARAVALDLSGTAAPPAWADEVRAIAGPTAVGYEGTVYLRRGRDLFRATVIGGSDPMADLAEILESW